MYLLFVTLFIPSANYFVKEPYFIFNYYLYNPLQEEVSSLLFIKFFKTLLIKWVWIMAFWSHCKVFPFSYIVFL